MKYKFYKITENILFIAIVGMTAVNIWMLHKTERKAENVYVICDVLGVYPDNNHVSVEVAMPNGTIQEYWYPYDYDLPDDFDEVVMESNNLDDYGTYHLVGLR